MGILCDIYQSKNVHASLEKWGGEIGPHAIELPSHWLLTLVNLVEHFPPSFSRASFAEVCSVLACFSEIGTCEALE